MDLEIMQAESTLNDFFDYISRTAEMPGSQITEEQVKQMLVVLRVMKVMYMSEVMVKKLMREGGIDPDAMGDSTG